MTLDFIGADCISGETPQDREEAREKDREDELLPARVAAMRELEASLLRSQKSLLALDLAGIERGTSEQAALVRKIDSFWPQGRTREQVCKTEQSTAPAFRSQPLELEQELRQIQQRILGAVRLQSALLQRSRAKLRVLANMLAGTGVPYGTLLAQYRGLSNPLTWK